MSLLDTELQPPTDPALPQGGPHWRGCERLHSACAYQLGKQHAEHTLLRQVADLIADLAHHDDPPARTVALHDAYAAVRRLAGLPPHTYPDKDDDPMPKSRDFAAELARLARAEEAEAEQEMLDRAALSGACADEADAAC
ncbi:hypothetical protein [Nonomuraea basaltis]|uniref:hypothetical protein n=1 Tax=Nonomuraea basaltis TaxID=2495887 RepID=UPI00110C484D|nr:hypothetical protein [Nonomuraea basaltis]TMR92405.1 hypothetical protein EJK15_44775 [Nonomuraea basaltis]